MDHEWDSGWSARTILHRTVEKRELLLGPNDSKTLEAMRAVAILCWIQKRDSQAELAMREILQRCEHTLGKSHPQTLLSICDLAIALSGATTKELRIEAQVLSQAAMFGSEDQFGLHHHKTLACYDLLMRFGLTHWTFTKERPPPFTHVENVGSGGFSTVSSVQRASTKLYAQKAFRILSGGRSDEFHEMILNEIDVLRHSNIHILFISSAHIKNPSISPSYYLL